MEQALVSALRAQNVDVLTVNDTKTSGQTDLSQLQLSTLENRVTYSHNIADFCRLHSEFVTAGKSHAGIALLAQDYSIGEQLKAIAQLVRDESCESMQNRLEFLSRYTK